MPGRSPRLPAIISQCPELAPDGELWAERKNFTPAQNDWRRRMVAFLKANREHFPLIDDATARDDVLLRNLVDRESATQGAITRFLQAVYPERDLGVSNSQVLGERVCILADEFLAISTTSYQRLCCLKLSSGVRKAGVA